MKTCRKCKVKKPDYMFPRKANGKPGVRTTCKQCVAEYVKNRRAKKREHKGPSKKRTSEKVTESVIVPVSFYIYKKIKAHTKRTDQSISHFLRAAIKDFIPKNKDELHHKKRKLLLFKVTPEFLKELNESKRSFTSRSELIKTAVIERLAFECEVDVQ